MKDETIRRLMDLRRLRKETALKILAVRQGAYMQAEAAVQKAEAAAGDHAQLAHNREQTALASFVGRQLRISELANLQSNLNAAADRQQELQENKREASKTRDVRQEEMKTSRSEFWRRHSKMEMLSSYIGQRRERQRRRQLAVAEAATEEAPGTHASPAMSRNPDA